MPQTETQVRSRVTLERRDLDRLFEVLRAEGYTVVGPVVREGAIVYDEVASTSDLPAGWTDAQEAGHYRLRRDGGPALFDWTVGPTAPKQYLHPATLTMWRARKNGSQLSVEDAEEPPRKLALVGVRACELAAIGILDRVLLGGPYTDPGYRARREGVLVVAVNCTRAGGTCFCASMGTGPAVRQGHDLALTERVESGRHAFVAEAGSARGRELLAALALPAASAADVAAAGEAVARAAAAMGRTLETEDLPALLAKSHEHPRWDDVERRCLTCGNCTSVCPTCFCTTIDDVADLTGSAAERVRRWDSCFSLEYSYIHGGSVRQSGRARYRQWLTHKLGTWHDQFGSSGCVGCGRCITWCPAGIDITEEARALREGKRKKEVRRANA